MAEQAMEFMKYDKISDDVFILGQNTVLKFNVSLSNIQNGNRYHFYKEYEYNSKSNAYPKLISIKRSFDYYLSIENTQKNKVTDDKAYIRIGPYDIYRFKSQLDQVYSWFTDKKFSKLYVSNRGKLTLTNPVPESSLGGYPMNKFLRFIPTIIESTNGMERGVELDLSNYNNYVVMSIDRFMGLHYTVSNFNMYLAAQSLVGYIGFPSGMNRFAMNNTVNGNYFLGEEFSANSEAVNERVIDSKKNISSLE